MPNWVIWSRGFLKLYQAAKNGSELYLRNWLESTVSREHILSSLSLKYLS